MKPIHRLTVRPALPAPLEGLDVLARNLRWTWDRRTRDLFRAVDREAWDASGCDPLRMLDVIAPERLQALADDEGFRHRLREAQDDLERYLSEPRWFQQRSDPGPSLVGYFSPEFGVTEVLPQYSGGLGVLAGDHLKAASDLGVPLVGIGLFYGAGYFRQSLATSGLQQEDYPALNPAVLPMAHRDRGRRTAHPGLHRGAGRHRPRAGVAGRGRAREPVPARRQPGGQRPGGARRHRPPLRRQHGASAAPGDPARRRRRPRPRGGRPASPTCST